MDAHKSMHVPIFDTVHMYIYTHSRISAAFRMLVELGKGQLLSRLATFKAFQRLSKGLYWRVTHSIDCAHIHAAFFFMYV